MFFSKYDLAVQRSPRYSQEYWSMLGRRRTLSVFSGFLFQIRVRR